MLFLLDDNTCVSVVLLILMYVFSEVLYWTDPYKLVRSQFNTLRVGEVVCQEIIDAWCDILNYKEAFRNSSSPFRMFLSHRTSVRLLLLILYYWQLRLIHMFYSISYRFLFCTV